MKENIIVASNVSETELLRTLAKYNKPTFNVRVMNPYDFALYALMKNGISLNEKYITSDEEAFILYEVSKSNDYYNNISFEDIINLSSSLDELRLNIIDNEKDTINKLKDGEFKEKNNSIIKLYNDYINELDKKEQIDQIKTIRTAINLINNKLDNVTVIKYNEFKLKPLENYLINKLANVVEESLTNSSNNISIKKYIKSYGMKTEIEFIINEIINNNIPFDKCLVVVPEEKVYSHIIKDYFNEFDIPYTMGIKESINNTNVGKLYKLIISWQDNFSFKNDFINLVNDVSFNKERLLQNIGFDVNKFSNTIIDYKNPKDLIFECFGKLRISTTNLEENNKKIDKCLNIKESLLDSDNSLTNDYLEIYKYVKKIIEGINKGIIYFIETYTRKIDESPNERLAFNKLKNFIELFNKYNIPQNQINKIISNLTYSSTQSSEGCIHITSINKTLSVVRDNVFIVGLSADNYPGSPKEDSVILDSDYELIGITDYSKSKITEKKNIFNYLIDSCSSNKANIYLSYAYYNEQTHKDQTLSSVLFNTYKRENGAELTLDTFNKKFGKDDKYQLIKMFNFNLSKNNKLINAKLNGAIIDEEKIEEKNSEIIPEGKNSFLDKKISASALEDFIKCEMYFYLKDCLYLETFFNDDNFEVIPANDIGTLIHDNLEKLKKKDTKDFSQKNIFIKNALNSFDEYLTFNVPLNNGIIKKRKEELKKYLENAYKLYSPLDTFEKEKDLEAIHESGLVVHGFPDRVVKNEDGTLTVIDYKVKNKIEHDINKNKTISQVALYAYILEKLDKGKVTSAEYDYIKQNKKIELNNECLKKEIEYINNVLVKLKHSLETLIFSKCSKTSECNHIYCPFKKICHMEENSND